jgi:hypothetical protein
MPGPAGDFSGLIDTEPIRSLDMPANAQRDMHPSASPT